MALLGRDAILNAKDLATKDIPVPEWGGEVRIRSLTAEERDKFEGSLVEMRKDGTPKRNAENVRARLAALCIVNENGERLFVDADIRALGRKSAVALQRVFNACQEFNGFTENDIEELAQGFASDPSEGSTSA